MFKNKQIILLAICILGLVNGQIHNKYQDRILAATGDITALSSVIKVNSFINLHYQIDGTDLIMMVEATDVGWVGIGFSATMTNCDMVIFTTENMVAKVTDVYSKGTITPTEDAQQDWTLVGSDIQSTSFKIKAKRPLKTNDSSDDELTKDQDITFCSGWSKARVLEQHDSYISFSSKLSNDLGSVGANSVSTGVSEQALDVHKYLLFYGWGIGVDLSIFVARFLKTWKHYISIHALIFFILNVSTIVLEAIVIDGNKSKLEDLSVVDKDIKNHYIIGIVILALVILQHIGGIVLKTAIEGTNKRVAVIKKFHQVFGFILYILCKTNLLIGTDLSSDINDGIIITVISMAFLVIAEIISRIYHSKTHHQIYDQAYQLAEMNEQLVDKNVSEYGDLMRMLNEENREVSQIIAALPNLKWVVFNQGVYDITKFVHPGGQYIIKEIIGREIGRYLLGSLPLEGYNFPPHIHTSSSIKQLKSNLIGYLNYKDNNILQLNQPGSTNNDANNLRLFISFNMLKKEDLSNTTSRFLFQSDKVKINNVLKGVNWIGRHFQVKVHSQNKSRLYTQISSMTDDNIYLRNSLVDYAKQAMNNQNPSPVDMTKFNQFSSSLPFIIKKYNFPGALSQQIHNENTRLQYQIQGPLGIGLDLGDHTKNKKIAIMCVGTGILPFIDLFDVLLKKQLIQSLPNHKDKLDPLNLEYDKQFPGCQFSVYTGFASLDDFVGSEWICYLNQLSKRAENNLFKLYLKLSNGQVPDGVTKITDKSYGNFILSNINGDMFDRIYICGPPLMFSEVIQAFKQKGIQQEKIFIV